MAWDLWIFVWISLSVFVGVRSSTSSWAVGKMRGEVDSVGYFCYWRDLSSVAQFPHPADDTDHVCVEVQDFVLIRYDHSYVDLLRDPDIATSVNPSNKLFALYGQGQTLLKTMPKLQSNFSMTLFIFDEDGKILPGSSMERDVMKEQALFGITFPRMSPDADIADECLNEKCKLQVTFTIRGEVISLLDEGFDDSRSARIGANARATLLNKVVRQELDLPAFHDVTVSTAAHAESELLVTVTLPLTQFFYTYPVYLSPGNPLMDFTVQEQPKAQPRIDDAPLKRTDGNSETEMGLYNMETDEGYAGDESEIELDGELNISGPDAQPSVNQSGLVNKAATVIPVFITKVVAFVTVVFVYFRW